MSDLLNEFYWTNRVYMEDTDAGGIVYYVNYLKFMERARTERLRDLGFDKEYILDKNCMFVVHSISAEYKSPAFLDDMLKIEAHIMQLKRTSIIFRQNIYRADTLLCNATVKIACVNTEFMRPVAIPDPVYQSLSQITKP